MERSQVLDAMGQLKLYGMKAAFDEIITTAVKRQHEPQKIVGDLLNAEISEKQARSIKYQLTIAKLPLAKEIGEFDFEDKEGVEVRAYCQTCDLMLRVSPDMLSRAYGDSYTLIGERPKCRRVGCSGSVLFLAQGQVQFEPLS
jgi:DNA replication protein DnaC